MTLGQKIRLAFAVPVLFTLVTGGISVVRMRSLNNMVQSLAIGSVHGTNAVGRLAGIAKDIRGNIRGHITAANVNDKAKAERDLEELKRLSETEQRNYEATIGDPRERVLFATVPSALKRLFATAEPIFPISRDGEADRGMALFRAQTMPAYLDAQRAIESLARFKELDGDRKAATAAASVTDALRWTVGMVVVVIILFLVVLFKLTDLQQKNTDLGESETAERERNLVLQLVSEDKLLSDVLAAVQMIVERKYVGSICAIRLLSEGRLTFGSTSRLPSPYVLAAEGLPIDPPTSSCALAASTKRIAFTPRVDTDPVWMNSAAELSNHGIHACLSVPICSGYQDVLGTIAVFFPEQEALEDEQKTFLERTARLAAVAIETRFATDQLAFQAKHDSLTGLPNRVQLMEILKNRIGRSRNHNWAVIWLDLDQFKPVNDALGHQVGDVLLQAVGKRLRNVISSRDTAARIGGDEFVVVLDEADLDVAQAVAARIVHAIAQPFVILSHKIVVTASVGVCRFPEHGASADEVLRHADLAMYQAKHGGKNSFRMFDPHLAETASCRLEIDQLVRSAVDQGEMWLVYQPQVSKSGEIIGVEALLRWESPILGVVSPAQFIPVAEENGSIGSIGAWVLRSACEQAAVWHAEGHRIRMSVNVSASQFTRPDFFELVAGVLSETDFAAEFLELEITETGVMNDIDLCIDQMRRLRQLGVRIALDDFGKGNSSLSYLRLLPMDTLKIDRSFVKDVNAGGLPVIKAIITLATSMGLDTVGEGVESEFQSRLLRAEGCDLIQGYFFFRPMKAEALLSHLRQRLVALAS